MLSNNHNKNKTCLLSTSKNYSSHMILIDNVLAINEPQARYNHVILSFCRDSFLIVLNPYATHLIYKNSFCCDK